MDQAVKTEMQWDDLKSKLAIGSLVEGVVIAHLHFGAYVSLRNLDTPFVGLIEVIRFFDKKRRVTPSDFPDIGMSVRAVVVGFQDGNHQVALSIRPSDLAIVSKGN